MMTKSLLLVLVWCGMLGSGLSLASPASDHGSGWGGGSSSFAPAAEDLSAGGTDFSLKESALTIEISLSADILFDFDRADLRPEAGDSLRRIAQLIDARGRHGVLIEGYTDAKGTVPHNQKLSLDRAEAVRHWLAQSGGLATMQFTTNGLGAANPVAPNTTADGRDDPAGRQKNRRVEIVIRK